MNELHIKALEDAVKAVKKGTETFLEYCTDVCRGCPLNGMCDWDGGIDILDEDITHDTLQAYVEYHRKIEDESERNSFYETTGIDPAWYDHNEDRSEPWQD
jgi:hypothetical protein